MRVIYPGGFDLVHHGHVNALNTARTIAGTDPLIVGVNSDQLMRHYKRQPKNDEQQRIRDVKRLGIADDVILWEGPEGQDRQIITLQPDAYIAGTDWLTKDLAAQLQLPDLGWFDWYGITLIYLKRTDGISTTRLLQAAQACQ